MVMKQRLCQEMEKSLTIAATLCQTQSNQNKAIIESKIKNSANGIKQKGNAPPVNLLNSVRGNVFVPDGVKFVFFDEPSLKLVLSC